MFRALFGLYVLIALPGACWQCSYVPSRGAGSQTRRSGRTSLRRAEAVPAAPGILGEAAGDPGEPLVRRTAFWDPRSRRRQLSSVAFALLVGGLALAGSARRAEAYEEIPIYWGVGNYSHLQHEMVLKEASYLGRREGDITAFAGYAGGTGTGTLERLCSNGIFGAPDYASLGHAQVVQVSLPKESIPEFARLYLDEIPKRKPFERGDRYRPLIGLRKGMQSDVFPLIEKEAAGRVQFMKGEGNDPDKYKEGIVWVYDTRSFPWRPAELQFQFADDGAEKYQIDYKTLNKVMVKIGTINQTGCP